MSERRPLALHRALAEQLNSDTPAAWAPQIEANLDGVDAAMRGLPHVDNLALRRDTVEARNLETLRAVMVAEDADGIALRGVSPLGRLFSEEARLVALEAMAGPEHQPGARLSEFPGLPRPPLSCPKK